MCRHWPDSYHRNLKKKIKDVEKFRKLKNQHNQSNNNSVKTLILI